MSVQYGDTIIMRSLVKNKKEIIPYVLDEAERYVSEWGSDWEMDKGMIKKHIKIKNTGHGYYNVYFPVLGILTARKHTEGA